MADLDHIERLIIDLKESLEREIHGVRDDLRREMREGFHLVNSRLDSQGARLDRQGALLQVGSRWTSRMNDWAEKIDSAIEQKDREIADLRTRLERLESGRPPQ